MQASKVKIISDDYNYRHTSGKTFNVKGALIHNSKVVFEIQIPGRNHLVRMLDSECKIVDYKK